MDYPKISIVTPSYNHGKYLEETILSVLDQKYPNLEYLIIDGGSTDGSVDLIRKYEKFLTYWVSEPDKGMYDALQKGFSHSSGEIMGWINSDDKLHVNSLYTLAELFSGFKNVNWVQGIPNVIDEMGRIVFVGSHAEINKSFFYQKKHEKSRRYVQQESTFWRRSLWEKAGGCLSQQYRYAGDFELWIRFFQHDKLWNLNVFLGSFRLRSEGQISTGLYKEYINEANQILERFPLSAKQKRKIKYAERLDRISKRFALRLNGLKKRLGLIDETVSNNKIYFDPKLQRFKMH
jgi:glycosyltransferase involved in cell wall biosynthesis